MSSNPPVLETPYQREKGYASRYRDLRFQEGTGPSTHRREVRTLHRLLAGSAPPETGPWLDLACGTGRLSGELPGPVLQVDRHREMLAAAPGDRPRLVARASALPFADRQFAGSLCMRLFQHLPTAEERIAVLSELGRVTRGPILLSFFDALSLQHLRRLLARRLGKRRSGRGAIRRRQFVREAEAAGLRVERVLALSPWISEQCLVRAVAAAAD